VDARRGLRKARAIRYRPIEIRDSRWRQKTFGVLVGAAILIGAAGWYHYVTREPLTAGSSRLPEQVSPPTVPAPAGPTAAASPASLSPVEEPERGPVRLTAQELHDALRADPDGDAEQMFSRYRGRSVAWTASVTSAEAAGGRLRVELTDAGVRLLAWCSPDTTPSPGDSLTVRGELTELTPAGFVIEGCSLATYD
jgi:hypothetical protein